jgi:2-dehydro-3-deoxyphosphogluconate aldolase/(4S)-4-hydroxy-2-oxoglutarate aldolase
MTKALAMEWLKRSKLVPVIRAQSPEKAIEVCEALLEAGFDIFEITTTVPNAPEAIRELRRATGSRALIGAGTILTERMVEECLAAGSDFIVSPALVEEVVDYCARSNVLVAPGALTPTEILRAHHMGADLVKVFPCDALGGPTYLKSLRAPLAGIPLMPTGGVRLDTVAAYLEAGAVALGVGGDLVDLKLLETDPAAFIERARSLKSQA